MPPADMLSHHGALNPQASKTVADPARRGQLTRPHHKGVDGRPMADA